MNEAREQICVRGELPSSALASCLEERPSIPPIIATVQVNAHLGLYHSLLSWALYLGLADLRNYLQTRGEEAGSIRKLGL